MEEIEQLRYPVGRFKSPEIINPSDILGWIATIEKFPEALKTEVKGLSNEELEWAYRPDGWNIRQLVHHCADSHINSQIRFRLALTEDTPTIKPYLEAEWATLPDVSGPIEWSLEILTGLHARWVMLLKSLNNDDLAREYFHPEQKRKNSLDKTIALYAWHCQHHLAHIRLAKANKGAFKNN